MVAGDATRQRVRLSVTAVAAALAVGPAAVASAAGPRRHVGTSPGGARHDHLADPRAEGERPLAVRVTATDAAGKPLAGSPTMLILLAGARVGTNHGRLGARPAGRARALAW
jgi:hypothetical protein